MLQPALVQQKQQEALHVNQTGFCFILRPSPHLPVTCELNSHHTSTHDSSISEFYLHRQQPKFQTCTFNKTLQFRLSAPHWHLSMKLQIQISLLCPPYHSTPTPAPISERTVPSSHRGPGNLAAILACYLSHTSHTQGS